MQESPPFGTIVVITIVLFSLLTYSAIKIKGVFEDKEIQKENAVEQIREEPTNIRQGNLIMSVAGLIALFMLIIFIASKFARRG